MHIYLHLYIRLHILYVNVGIHIDSNGIELPLIYSPKMELIEYHAECRDEKLQQCIDYYHWNVLYYERKILTKYLTN